MPAASTARMGEAQRRFAVTHINLAHQQARRFSLRHGIPYDELLGAAYLGLCKGALGYDPARGHRPLSLEGELTQEIQDDESLAAVACR